MRKIERIVTDVGDIYHKNGQQAREYLLKARRLREQFGTGPAIVYSWFYSVPQKWIQVEPKIFQLMKQTNLYNLDTILSLSEKRLATMMRPVIFYNQVSTQLKNFCGAVRDLYVSWDRFAEALGKERIFRVFRTLRNYENNRVTFKNLAAMKSFVGMNDDLVILDTYVAKVMGISKQEVVKYRTRVEHFKNLLRTANKVTKELQTCGINDISTIRWSLAIWFSMAKIQAGDLLSNNIIY